MQTHRIPVALGVELTVDTWEPAPRTAEQAPDPVPFVLVHGLASNARLWDGVAARLLAAGHPVVTVDQRGHGRSSKPDDGYDMATVADDLAAVIDALGIGRAVVAGQSWGGNVALELGVRRPDLLRGIVCVDGGWIEPSHRFASWDACVATLAPPRLAGRPRAEIEGHMRARHPDWPDAGIRGALANFEVRPDGTVAPWLTFDRHLAILRGLWEHHPSTRYPNVAVPVLLVPARHPDGEDPERARDKQGDVDRAAAAIPNARVRWFTGDHDIHGQHPDELADVMSSLAHDGFFA